MSKKQTPAEVVLSLLGIRPLARQLKIDPTTVQRWKKKGMIPSEYHVDILALGGGELTSDDLVYGR